MIFTHNKPVILILHLTVILASLITTFTAAGPINISLEIQSPTTTTTEEPEITTTFDILTTTTTAATSSSTSTTTTTKAPPKKSPPKRIINVSDAPVGLPVASPKDLEGLPKNFDGRTAWSQCPSLKHVSDQGSCGSCWAVITTDLASDRLCIASNGTIQVRLSPMHLLQCCGLGDCSDGIVDFGACAGGDPWGTWRYFTEHGIVTERCKPYPSWVKWLGINTFTDGGLDSEEEEQAVCRKQCSGNSSLDYEDELYFGRSYYRLPVDEGTIRREIFTHGPVVTHISVSDPYLDTHHHEDAQIYRCPERAGIATHGVRLIGWGEEKNDTNGQVEKYWLAVNSWGRDWGRNGTFRIARGSNSCHVEEFVSTVLPKV